MPIQSTPLNTSHLTSPHIYSYTSKRAKIDQERQLLPAWSARARLIDLMRGHATVVVVGETGSGKTTQLPRFLFEAGLVQGGAIACTQPRYVHGSVWSAECG